MHNNVLFCSWNTRSTQHVRLKSDQYCTLGLFTELCFVLCQCYQIRPAHRVESFSVLYIRVVHESPVLFCAFVTRSTQHVGSAAADTNPSSLCDRSPPATGADCHATDGILRSVVKQGNSKTERWWILRALLFPG